RRGKVTWLSVFPTFRQMPKNPTAVERVGFREKKRKCVRQFGNRIVFGPGEDGVALLSPELRSNSRSLALLTCCALPSDICTFPCPRWILSVHPGVCVPALKFVP